MPPWRPQRRALTSHRPRPAAGASAGRWRPSASRSPSRPGPARASTSGRARASASWCSAEQIEQAAGQQYAEMMQQARSRARSAPDDHPQVVRLRAIAQRIIPVHRRVEPARQAVALGGQPARLHADQCVLHAGRQDRLLQRHPEPAAAGRRRGGGDHGPRDGARAARARARAHRQGPPPASASIGCRSCSAWASLGDVAANIGGQLLTLKFGREDETEADLVGLELAARAGYDPRGGVTLWQKMSEARQGRAAAMAVDPPGRRARASATSRTTCRGCCRSTRAPRSRRSASRRWSRPTRPSRKRPRASSRAEVLPRGGPAPGRSRP